MFAVKRNINIHSRRSITAARVEPLEKRDYLTVVTVTSPVAINFATHADFNAGNSPVAMVAADFSGGGNQDLAVADQGDDTVRIFLGSGNGTFSPGAVLQLNSPPTAMITGDFNGDGLADLAVACTATASDPSTSVTVFLNTGNDTFAAGQTTIVETGAYPNEPVALTSGDFNGDKKLDLAVTEYSQQGVAILFGNGNGTFDSPVVYGGDAYPTAIASGLFTGGSLPDLVLASTSVDPTTQIPSNTLSLLQNDGTGNFSDAQNLLIGTSGYSSSITAADVTGAGSPDVVVGNTDNTLSVFLNTGGQFELSATPTLPGGAAAVATADLNLDGVVDLISANGGTSASTSADSISAIAGLGAGSYTTPINFSTGNQPTAIAVGDFNDDGKPDIATANEAAGTISILLNSTAITQISTKTVLSSTDLSEPAGSPVDLTATITASSVSTLPNESLPTGEVDFYAGTTFLGDSNVDTGANTAEFTAIDLPVGPNKLTAVYRGDEAYNVSTSASITETVTPTSTQGPDLVGTFISSSLPATAVPGETANIKVRVTNQGNSLASGAISNGLYLSLDTTLDTDDPPITLKGALAGGTIHLNPNQSVVLSGTFTLPADTPLADYDLLVWLNQTGALAESDSSNNVFASTGSYNVVDGFGTIGGRPGITLQVPDANGTIGTFKLIGPGNGTVNVSDEGVDVVLDGTTAASSLSITTKPGHGPLQLSDITVDSAVGAVRAPDVSISDMISLPGGAATLIVGPTSDGAQIVLGNGPATTVSLGAVNGTALTAASGLRSLTVTAWSNTSADQISAPWIGSLVSKGDFGAGLSLSGVGAPGGVALQSASIGGNLGDEVWSVDGAVNRLKAGSVLSGWSGSVSGSVRSFAVSGNFAGDFAGVSFGSVAITGSVDNADILAGASFGADGRLGDGDDTFGAGSITSLHVLGGITGSVIAAGLVPSSQSLLGSGATLVPGGSIGSIVIGGQIDTQSRVLAQTLAKTAKVAGVPVDTGTDATFSLFTT